MAVHTQTHEHVNANALARKGASMPICTHASTHACKHTHLQAHTHASTHTCKHTHTYKHAHVQAQTYTHTQDSPVKSTFAMKLNMMMNGIFHGLSLDGVPSLMPVLGVYLCLCLCVSVSVCVCGCGLGG